MFKAKRHRRFFLCILIGTSFWCFSDPIDEMPKIIGTGFSAQGAYRYCFARTKPEERISENLSDVKLKLETAVENLREKRLVASLTIHSRRDTVSHLTLTD